MNQKFLSFSPPPALINDTSFCAGDSVVLNAGAGFLNYSWNTGSNNNSITAKNPGTYILKATDSNHCTSTDSFQVLQVFSDPSIDLGSDSILCADTTRTLNAGYGYASYLWQDGSTTLTYTVSATGSYWVKVKDMNGCIGADTINITASRLRPSAFLPPDTTICNYATLLVLPLQTFDSYAWSTCDVSPEISVNQSGIYWLTVVDEYGCEGTDSIQVSVD
jgi:hypothetical protein